MDSSNPYKGFELVNFIDDIRKKNIEEKHKGTPESNPPYKTFIPLEWRKDGQRWFTVTEISKCLRWAGYKALGEIGIPRTLKETRKMEVGTSAHYRLEREFGLISLASEIRIFDQKNFIYGKCDIMARNYITGELFPVDFKNTENWFFGSRIKREGLRPHLKKTTFYQALPDDEFQVMLYIRMWRKLVQYPEIPRIPIRFGLVIYENRNDPNLRKSCLVEYDENLMAKFFEHLRELNSCLDKGKNIPPYIPKEGFVHIICPYRLKCPRGQEAVKEKIKKKNLPLWKIYELKKRAKQEMPKEPELKNKLF